jgi:hypothetical protein
MKMLPKTKKGVRMLLGIVMLCSFLDFAMTIYFFSMVMVNLDSLFSVAVFVLGYNFLYIPCVMLICLCYLLLTRVFKYEA